METASGAMGWLLNLNPHSTGVLLELEFFLRRYA